MVLYRTVAYAFYTQTVHTILRPAMTDLSADVATKDSSEGIRFSDTSFSRMIWLFNFFLAAKRLIDSYYLALESNRNSISSFYMLSSAMPDGKPLPAIVYNGNVIPTAADMQKMFLERMPATRYEVQSFDCQVINPNYIAANSEAAVSTAGKNMTILVTVSGYVKYGGSRDAATRGFSESFILEPSHDAAKGKSQGRKFKDWLIQSQNFRLVV